MIEEILKHCRKGPGGRRNDILLPMLYKWRKGSIRGAKMGIQNDGELFNDADVDAMRKENDEFKKALGEAHLDIKILKKVRDGCPKTCREDIQITPEDLKCSFVN